MRLGMGLLLLCGVVAAAPVVATVEVDFDPTDPLFSTGGLTGTIEILGEDAVSGVEPEPFTPAGERFTTSFEFVLDAAPDAPIFLRFDGTATESAVPPTPILGAVYALPAGTVGFPPDPVRPPIVPIGEYPPDPLAPDPFIDATLPLFGFASDGVPVGSIHVTISHVPEPALSALLLLGLLVIVRRR